MTRTRKLLLVALAAVLVAATLLVVSKLGDATAHYTPSNCDDSAAAADRSLCLLMGASRQGPANAARTADDARSEIVRILAITLGVVLVVGWAL